MNESRSHVSILNSPSRPGRTQALVVRGGDVVQREELLSGEEPLQIRACGPGQRPEDVAITMRTPGSEQELAIGFLVSEGLVSAGDAPSASFEFGDPQVIAKPEDEIVVRLPTPMDLSAVAQRHFVATASCGICGRATLDELVARVERVTSGLRIHRAALQQMPEAMRAAQVVFAETGGLHAAALFGPSGELVELREDIGRHNAVDKVIGSMALAGKLPLSDMALLVSGRASFEITQKVATAGIPILAAISAPSDLAVETAQRLGMTLVGFLRDRGFNIYTGEERIALVVS